MSRNSSGTYTLPAGNPVVTGSTITSVWGNTTMSDIANALTDSLSRTGLGGMSAGLPLFAGTSALPGLAWGLELNSGLYRAGAGDFRWVVTTTELLQLATNTLRFSGTAPAFLLRETDAAANNGLWRILASAEQLLLETRNDANSAGSAIVTIDRTGTTVDSIALAATALTWNGSAMVNVASSPTWTGAHVFTNVNNEGAISLQSSIPILGFVETDAAANNRRWRWFANGEQFVGAAFTDDFGSSNSWAIVDRTGAVIDRIRFQSNSGALLDVENAISLTSFQGASAPMLLATSSNPSIYIQETDGPVDEKVWRLTSQAGDFQFQTRNDANSAGATFLTIARTGTTVDSIAFASTAFTWNGNAFAVGANPTGTIGLTAVNGAAATFLRSDGAPALSQAIAPTWTAQHIFSLSGATNAAILLSSAQPQIDWNETDAAANNRRWRVEANGTQLLARLVNDANSSATTWLSVSRSANTATTIAVTGNTISLTGSTQLAFSGPLNTPNSLADEVGFKGVPQNDQSGNYTCVLLDAGLHIKQNTSSSTITIPANASVAYPIGTVLTFYNNSAGNISIAITSDTLLLAGTASTGTRTLAAVGLATALKVASTAWIISGTGLS